MILNPPSRLGQLRRSGEDWGETDGDDLGGEKTRERLAVNTDMILEGEKEKRNSQGGGADVKRRVEALERESEMSGPGI